MKELKLTLAGTTFMKLMYLMKKTTMEVSGYGLSKKDNLFYIHDFRMPKQIGQTAHTELTQDGIAEHFDQCLAEGLEPIEFGRIWVHTHPKGINGPSGTDEATMRDTFGACDWAIMLILTQGEHFHCEFWTKKLGGVALGEHLRLPMKVQVDWSNIQNIDTAAWDAEFTASFEEKKYTYTGGTYNWKTGLFDGESYYEKKSVETKSWTTYQDAEREKLRKQIEEAHDKGHLKTGPHNAAVQDLNMGVPLWQIREDVENAIQGIQYPKLSQPDTGLAGELRLALDCKEITQQEFNEALAKVANGEALPPKIEAILYGSPRAGEADKDALYELFIKGEIDTGWYNTELDHLEKTGSLSPTAYAMIQLQGETPYMYE